MSQVVDSHDQHRRRTAKGCDRPWYMQPPLQGLYAPRLHYGPTNLFNTPFLSQVGMVPEGAYWMTFLFGGGDNFQVTLEGVEIPMFPIEGGRLAGDVSASPVVRWS
jgi:hypothetical protein